MPREKSNRGNNREDQKSSRGGRQNISSRRESNSMEEPNQRRNTKTGRSLRNERGRISEDSDRSE